MPSTKKLLQAAAGNAGESLYVEDVFSTYLYTGTGSDQTITNGIDLDGEGGAIWFKSRSNATNHRMFDTERGRSVALTPDTTAANGGVSPAGKDLASFNSDGFTVGEPWHYDLNTLNRTYASWSFRKAEKFFDIITWVGDGTTTQVVPHNLGSVPAFSMKKAASSTSSWGVMALKADGNYANGRTTYDFAMNTTEPASTLLAASYRSTATDYYPGDVEGASPNTNGVTFVAYLFASDAGGFGDDGDESIIKCGSFTNESDGSLATDVDLGWEPQYLLLKSISTTGSWNVVDMMRGLTVSGEKYLRPNTTGAEGTVSSKDVFPTATGFGNTGVGILGSPSATFVYIAIRRPMKTPESGTEVFATRVATEVEYNNTVDYGITTDLLLNRYYKSGSQYTMPFDRMRGSSQILYTPLTDPEGTLTLGTGNKGFGASQTSVTWPQIANSSVSNVTWAFKRAPGFFDVVAGVGTGAAAVVPHGLTVAPELVIWKSRSGTDTWRTLSTVLGEWGSLDTNAVFTATNIKWYFGDDVTYVAPTATDLYMGQSAFGNTTTFIAYLFATLAGVSKVGSYTGTGYSALNVDCGFSAGARFILIKRTDSTGDWYVWDSERGIVAGNDPYLLLNSTAAEVTSTDYIDPLASGFTVTSSAPAALNASGGTYIFLAIA